MSYTRLGHYCVRTGGPYGDNSFVHRCVRFLSRDHHSRDEHKGGDVLLLFLGCGV